MFQQAGSLWTVLAVCLSVLFALRCSEAQIPRVEQGKACSRENLTRTADVAGFVFHAYRNEDSGLACLLVLKEGRVIFRRTGDNGGTFILGQQADAHSDAKSIPNGTDITGRGHPDMIVSEYTGGAHCCLFAHVFELQPKFRLVATLDAEHADGSHFEDRNGTYYYLTADWAFAYWPQSFAGSPSVKVILRFVDDEKGGSYHLALDKMKKPPLEGSRWQKQIDVVRSDFGDPTWELSGPTIFQPMLDLIYSGNAAQAWRLLDLGWPRSVKGKIAWVEDFCSILKSSLYYGDLDRPLDGAPRACIAVKPKFPKA